MKRYRNRPISLQTLDALISRLPEHHPKIPQLRQQAAREQKGFNGERKLDYYVERLPHTYSVLHDLCFTFMRQRTQIDSLLISAYAIYIIEVKNYHGEVTFNTNLQQFFRSNEEGEKEGFKYPLTQAEHIKMQLQLLLQENDVEALPIYYFIAFADASTIFHVIGDEKKIGRVVTYVEDVPLRMMKIDRQLSKKQAKPVDESYRNRIVTTLMRNNEDFSKDSLKEFDILPREILPGIHCEQCKMLGMKRRRGHWICSHCRSTSKTAHRKALQDYRLLIGSKVTNKTTRSFLQIESRHITKKLLQQTDFIEKQTNRIWKIHPAKHGRM